MNKPRNSIVRLWLAIAILSMSGTALGQQLECETVDFNTFSHADPVTNLALFGGELSLAVTAFRNQPAANVSATAYDMELYDRMAGGLPAPPNATHDDTQRFILCNDAANGGNGTCDGVSLMIPDTDFIANADDTQGGLVTLTGFDNGQYTILNYDAVDSDANNLNIILRVGAGLTQIGTSNGLGDGSVETVVTTGQLFTGQAQFEYQGSGSIDDIEICRVADDEPAALGDRVWEDIDRDGVQDCSDDNNNGVIGDAGDSGPECDTGIPNLPVELLDGDCMTPLGQMTMTDANGFYLFDNLQPGDYCVRFTPPGDDFCDSNGFALGTPVFTGQNDGPDDIDSDADPDSGISDPTNLSSGESDLTIDAGVYCPAKLGNLVWFDDNENGIQDPGEDGVPGVKTTLWDCGDDMVAGTADDMMTDEMRFTDNDGMYMYGAEDDYDLPPGKYYVHFDPSTFPPGFDFTTPGVGPDDVDSDCLAPSGRTECTDLTESRTINLDRDCGLIPPPPPECNLLLDKTCRVESPPPPPLGDCNGKLQQFTVLWTGPGPITASGPNNSEMVNTGEEATFVGPFSNNDVVVTISGAVQGNSTFHVSCSDDDFNDPSDCGKFAGNGKNNDSQLINEWKLEGFIDADGEVLDCNPDASSGDFADDCTFEPLPLPTCENGPKPDNLTWRYDGGTNGNGNCADSTFFTIVNDSGKMHDDFECTGVLDTSLQVTAEDGDNNVFLLNPGDSFTTARGSNDSISLTDSAGNTQELRFHTSCSQPLEAQATAGALTLAALDNRDGGQDVTYRYEVSNLGDPLSNVGIEDDQLGTIASGLALGTNDSEAFDRMAKIFGTTVNTAQASGVLGDGSVCEPTSAFDSVTIEAVIPPCSLSIELDEVKDDSLKIDITNNDTRSRTLNLSVSFPAEREHVKEVKLDGTIYKRGDSANPVNGTPAFFGPDEWTEDDVSKRQIEPGNTETLEIKTTKDGDKDGRFEVGLDFGEGCESLIIVENQQLVP